MRKKWDWLLFLTVLAIGSLSLLVIYSINKSLAASQIVFWAFGLTVLVLTSFFDYKAWQKLSIVFYVIVLVTLLLLFLVGEPIRGSVRWINLGLFRFQPSEIAKVATILVLSAFFLERSAANLKNLLVSILVITPAVILILIQPDIGNVLVILGIWFGMSFASGFRLKHLVFLTLLFFIISLFLFKALAPYQQERIKSFMNPETDPLGTGYQIIQSKIAVGSGELTGRGLGQGSQSQLKFLPEAESDFIFASTVEQMGFIGGSLLLIFITVLSVKILRIGQKVERFGQLITVGAVSFLTLQYTINIAMNMGLLPITGITLPLYSYGGSSLASSLFLLGIVFSIRS